MEVLIVLVFVDAMMWLVARKSAATTDERVRPRSTVEVVEVRLRGERVGILSPTQTSNIRPLVEHVERAGNLAVARAEVTGNSVKAEVLLFAEKAQAVPRTWLDLHS